MDYRHPVLTRAIPSLGDALSWLFPLERNTFVTLSDMHHAMSDFTAGNGRHLPARQSKFQSTVQSRVHSPGFTLTQEMVVIELRVSPNFSPQSSPRSSPESTVQVLHLSLV